jgi:hypothetical protein
MVSDNDPGDLVPRFYVLELAPKLTSFGPPGGWATSCFRRISRGEGQMEKGAVLPWNIHNPGTNNGITNSADRGVLQVDDGRFRFLGFRERFPGDLPALIRTIGSISCSRGGGQEVRGLRERAFDQTSI